MWGKSFWKHNFSHRATLLATINKSKIVNPVFVRVIDSYKD